VANERARVELQLEKDARLVAGVGAAVTRLAGHAGFDARAQTDLATATEEASCEILPLLAGAKGRLRVRIESFADRIEVALEYRGAAIRGTAATGSSPAGLNGLRLLPRVDRVAYDAQGDTSRMTLIKYRRAPARQE
jgi:anti-sigma regulatory factor (Ser/Thr protein kinase)